MNPYASDMRYMPADAPGGNMMTSEKDIKENTTENKAENKASGDLKKVSKYSALIISISATLAMMLLLAAATFAWFSDTAVTKGSSVITGYMGADLLVNDEAIKDYIRKSKKLAEDAPVSDEEVAAYVAEKGLDTYTRTVKPEGQSAQPEETYYRITDKEMNVITLDHVEPGQAYPVHFFVANTGQLAFTFSAGFRVEESLTGLMRLDKEVENGLFGDIEDPESGTYFRNNPDYKLRHKVLISEQSETVRNEETGELEPVIDPATGKPVDHGGYLEDVLEVYIGKNRDDIKPENYVGTLADIIGKATVSEIGAAGGSDDVNGQTAPRNQAFTGYLLPRPVVEDEYGHIVPQHVEVYEGTTLIRTIENATELGGLNFIVFAPYTMEDEYQYASIKISLGAYTTQVEYEKDGTDCMIYDSGAHGDMVDTGETPPETDSE